MIRTLGLLILAADLILAAALVFFFAAVDLNHGQVPEKGNRCPTDNSSRYCP